MSNGSSPWERGESPGRAMRTVVAEQMGSAYLQSRKTRCRMCRLETKGGHAITVCLFAMSRRLEKLEERLAKAGLL